MKEKEEKRSVFDFESIPPIALTQQEVEKVFDGLKESFSKPELFPMPPLIVSHRQYEHFIKLGFIRKDK